MPTTTITARPIIKASSVGPNLDMFITCLQFLYHCSTSCLSRPSDPVELSRATVATLRGPFSRVLASVALLDCASARDQVIDQNDRGRTWREVRAPFTIAIPWQAQTAQVRGSWAGLECRE